MSYYRDQLNPEAVHFPAKLHIAATYLIVLIALLVAAVLTLIYGRGGQLGPDLGSLAACALLVWLYYPKHISTSDVGVQSVWLMGLRRQLIRWDEINSVQERPGVPLLPAFAVGPIANWEIVVRSLNGTRPIRLTCRHSGRRAFLHELKRWGAPEAALKNPLDREL